MSDEERKLVNSLFITKSTAARSLPDKVNFYYFNNDTSLLAQASNVTALFYTFSDSIPSDLVCGRSSGSLVRDLLAISFANIHTVGDDIMQCSPTETHAYNVMVVVYAQNVVEFSVGLGVAFGVSSLGLREMTTEGVRDGIGITSEWFLARRLVKDGASVEKMRQLRNFFDRRQFEQSLTNVTSVSALASPFFPIQFWLPLASVAIFASCAALSLASKARRKFELSWLAPKVDRFPLSVIAVLTILIGAGIAFLRALLGLWT